MLTPEIKKAELLAPPFRERFGESLFFIVTGGSSEADGVGRFRAGRAFVKQIPRAVASLPGRNDNGVRVSALATPMGNAASNLACQFSMRDIVW
jgi:hypothetical protein